VRAIVTHPDEYGLDIGTIPNQPYFAQVKLKDPIDVKLAARLANVPVDEFLSLNPAYSRKIVRSDTPRPVLLPVEKADLFAANLENYDQPLVSWDTYSGHRGEKLSAIAAKYRVTVGWILEHNNLKVGHGRLTRAQTLVVPASSLSDASWKRVREHQVETASSDATATRSPDASTPAGEDRANEVSHVVAKGDTISRIARRYGVTPQDIRNWNSLESDSLSIGQSLTLRTSGTSPDSATKDPEPARKATKPTRSSQRHYTVRRGDSLYSIAKRFDIGVERIKRANHLVNHRRLAVGKKLVIPTSNDS
jgi:membrane-bound lytic murein transglycosylase D